MTKQHSSNYWFSYKAERASYYASGDNGSGTAGGMTKMTTSGTAFMKPVKKPKMPVVKWQREEFKSCGDDEYARIVYNNGKYVQLGEIVNHLQAKTWLTNVMLGAAGAVPNQSYIFHWQHGLTSVGAARRFETFGVLAQKWHLHVEYDAKKLPTQTTKFLPYDTKTDEGAGTDVSAFDRLAFLTTVPCLSKDVTITINTIPIKYKTLDVYIEKVFEDVVEQGSNCILEPLIDEYKVRIEINFQDPTITNDLILNEHEFTEVDTAGIGVIITLAAPMSATLTATNMRVATSNNEELPEFGIRSHDLVLVPNTGFTWALT